MSNARGVQMSCSASYQIVTGSELYATRLIDGSGSTVKLWGNPHWQDQHCPYAVANPTGAAQAHGGNHLRGPILYYWHRGLSYLPYLDEEPSWGPPLVGLGGELN